MAISIAVVRETLAGEKRVALVPEVAKKFSALGATVLIEKSAGASALIPDGQYAGCEIVETAADALARADVVLKVQPPTLEEIAQMKPGAVCLGYMAAHLNLDRVKALQERNISAFSVELIPRISRAQSMDALSSQAGVAGYKAVLIAAMASGKFFPMLTTAAGTMKPSKCLVVGAGVAGLQALATARRLGAITEGFDVRPETREQIESLGAKFLDLGVSAAGSGGYARELTAEEKALQQSKLADHLKGIDVVITTAAIPGRPSPKIITRAMVDGMKAGSVIVDIAAEGGGNCELTEPGKTIEHNGVTILGPLNVPSMQPIHASDMYARNLLNYLSPFLKAGELKLDFADEIIAKSCVTHAGEIKHEPTRKLVEG